ncbi:hypothetical protein H9L10_10680 [Phycicoccus endophyticus]|uniref:Alpha/beta hydrolase n=1 Tax=Phycicoccus endophyticus TaxID=1690220 RepID=A0A7G9QZI2_9MICO|nr:hypothetical protein [Phycicoccus endophyticus]NHI19121.1 hypothetical protein [Phycicoccus endophyticus]QNN48757.1 hypothetical protein H9L10_10680 [Phycicoccus endophyticus]GGL32943.1 hypothetical protein GCM10012283_14210 [Phycicoccus endophyticus]
MTRVAVRSAALLAAAQRLSLGAEELRAQGESVGGALTRCRSPGVATVGDLGLLAAWVRLEGDGLRLVGPAGLWGEALALDALAVRLRVAARAYAEVEEAAASVLAGVHSGADAAGRAGLFEESGAHPVLRRVAPTWSPAPVQRPADLVALGEGLDGGRVRVVEVADPGGGSAWVVAVPGTQTWSPRAGANPFDLTADVRSVTGDATLAAAGVTAALDAAMRASARRRGVGAARVAGEPVLLVGHSQGGIHAAAIAADPDFGSTHRVTHVLTTGAPVGVFAVPERVRVLSVEHADDPVPTLDLTPNPARASWLTLRVGDGPATDPGRHALGEYESTVRAAQDAPRGTVPGLAGWEVSAAAFLRRPVRSVNEVAIERGWQNPRP